MAKVAKKKEMVDDGDFVRLLKATKHLHELLSDNHTFTVNVPVEVELEISIDSGGSDVSVDWIDINDAEVEAEETAVNLPEVLKLQKAAEDLEARCDSLAKKLNEKYDEDWGVRDIREEAQDFVEEVDYKRSRARRLKKKYPEVFAKK